MTSRTTMKRSCRFARIESRFHRHPAPTTSATVTHPCTIPVMTPQHRLTINVVTTTATIDSGATCVTLLPGHSTMAVPTIQPDIRPAATLRDGDARVENNADTPSSPCTRTTHLRRVNRIRLCLEGRLTTSFKAAWQEARPQESDCPTWVCRHHTESRATPAVNVILPH